MIELCKKPTCVGEKTVSAFSQAFCEADMIVPDTKPDMVKLLQWDATVAVTGKTCHNDRMVIEGKACITILYLGEDGRVCGMSTTQPFSHIVDAKGVTEGMESEVETDVENIDCLILNSRKLSVKVLIGVDMNATVPVEVNLCTGLSGDPPYQTLTKTIKPYSTVARAQEQLCLKERLEVPAGKPSVDTVLSMNAKLATKEVKAIHDKVILKGTVCVTTLYLGDMDDTGVQFMEHEIPFAEAFEAPGMDENAEVNCNCNVAQVYYDVAQDSDGDNRMLNVECIIDANAKASNETQMEVIEDAYCTQCPLMVAKENTEINRLIADTKTQLTLKDVATIPPEEPDIAQVYNVNARPFVATTKIEQGKVVIEGVIDTHILYLSSDPNQPVNTYKHEHPFSQQIEMDGIDDSMTCDINLSMEHVNYNISMAGEVELRFGVALDLRVITTEDVVYLSDVQQGENEGAAKPNCCMRVYFVRKGDRLWDIAKKYRTTIDRILQANDMSNESELYNGKQLIIQ